MKNDSDGNADSQFAILIVRALATGGVKLSDLASLVVKELIVFLVYGLTLGAVFSIIGS